jgi:hypothetical protein
MKKKLAYAVFSTTDSGKEYLVKGGFGNNKGTAEKWAVNHANDKLPTEIGVPMSDLVDCYTNGLFVKKIEY